MRKRRWFSEYSENEQKEILIRFIQNQNSELCNKLLVQVEELYRQYSEILNKLSLLK